VIELMLGLTIASRQIRADVGTCGGATTTVPFTDVAGNPFFCQIAEAYFSALTNGTTPTTYSPGLAVPRDQMAAFVTRTLDRSLQRGSRRAALKQFWTPTSPDGIGLTTVGSLPELVESDGADIWVANVNDDTVSRVRASDGKLLETWTGAPNAFGVKAVKGLIFVTGANDPAGSLYQIDPSQPPGAVTTVSSSLGRVPGGIAFDGARIWTVNGGGLGVSSVSIVTLNPVTVTTVTAGFTKLRGIVFDGANMWVTERGTMPGKLYKLDSNGAIIQTVIMGGDVPANPAFDGTNIWVPNLNSDTVTVVRAATGVVLATLSGNGLSGPTTAAFDGERILITNSVGNSVSLWKATDLTPIGVFGTGVTTSPVGACSDGLNFWITLFGADQLARF